MFLDTLAKIQTQRANISNNTSSCNHIQMTTVDLTYLNIFSNYSSASNSVSKICIIGCTDTCMYAFSYSLSWRCTSAAVLSAVSAQTFSSSTDWTSSSFRRSSLIRRVSRCLGTPDTAGWTQHHNAATPLVTLCNKTQGPRPNTYPPAQWRLCHVWCGMWWREPERRRCRCRWGLPT